MCTPAILPVLSSAGAALTGTTAAAGTAAAAANAQLAIKGIQAGAAVFGAISKANEKNKAVARNAQSAKDAYFVKTKQANRRILQEQIQASQQKQDADLKALKAQGTASAAAAGAGVQGVDVDRLMDDFERSEGVLTDRISQRLEGMQQQNEMDKLAFQSEANNRINSMQPQSFAETLFNVVEPLAGFGLDYYDTQSRMASLEAN